MIQWWDKTSWPGVMSVCTAHLGSKISKAPDSSGCHCPAKSSIFTPLAKARTTNSSPELDINDRLLPSTMFCQKTEITRRSWSKVLLALTIVFAFYLSSRSAISVQTKTSCFSGVKRMLSMLSPTPPTRVPLNKEGITCIGRPQIVATRVYIGTATAI